MAIYSVSNLAGSGSTDYLSQTSVSDFSISDTDTMIVGGWIDSSSGSGYRSICSNYRSTAANHNFNISMNNPGGIPRFRVVRFAYGTFQPFEVVDVVMPTTGRHFILAWVTPTSLNLQIDNGTVVSSTLPAASFSFPCDSFRMFNTQLGGGGPMTAVLDNWFVCKNPSNLTTALTTIQNDIYNTGAGTEYFLLTPTQKIDMGLVSWWSFNETGLSSKLDDHGSNDFTVNGTAITNAPSITTNFIEMLLSDSLSSSDVKKLMDDKSLFDVIFLNDVLRTSPLLKFNADEIKFSDWLTVKRNPPISQWHD